MDLAFLVPLSSSCYPAEIDPHTKLLAQAQIDYWSDRLESLSRNATLWPQIRRDLKKLPKSNQDFIAQFAQTNHQRSLLHLAVLHDQMECVEALEPQKCLLERRDRHGLTPVDLARFLHKRKSLEALSEIKLPAFCHQPNVEISSDETFLNLDYLSHPVFDSAETLEEILLATQKAKINDRISSDRIWMGIYYDTEIQRVVHPAMAVKRIDDKIGFGVFANERILPLSFVGEYTGLIQRRQAKHVKSAEYCFRYSAWPMGNHRYVIDAQHMGNFTRLINHNDHPNVGLVCAYWRGFPRLILLSLKEIRKNEQLTIDYGPVFWKQTKKHKINL